MCKDNDKCPICKGTGKVNLGIKVRCFSCNGTGIYKDKKEKKVKKHCGNCKCKDIDKS